MALVFRMSSMAGRLRFRSLRPGRNRAILQLSSTSSDVGIAERTTPLFRSACLYHTTMSATTVKLNDGTEVPAIAYGTGTALFGKDCANSIKLAIECGFTHLDGAQAYGNEAFLGEGIRAAGKPRSELYIVTKLKPGLKAADVKPSLVESLQKFGMSYRRFQITVLRFLTGPLGIEFVDLFLIHAPPRGPTKPEDGTIQDLWHAMETVHAEGLAKSIGVSNFTVNDLKAILPSAKIVPSVNQIEIHPSAPPTCLPYNVTEMFHRYIWKDAAEPIVKYGRENGNITPASYGGLSPLVRAAGGPVDEVLPPIVERLGKVQGKPVTPAQVLSKWVSHKGAIVVTTSSKEARIKEYLEASNVPDLTAEEIQAIDDAGAKQQKRFFMRQLFE
ncbi:Aldo-ket-red domain-containing protein [Mycena venus]|uniref:Aldo-ket-red domain-containing protein n=1 Tax=Mycena venus TaxID=2733690 RepID=A0A8H7CJE0_9AGAR|nr:Aldo-ket-red domain-containing protein [Mycena venus]